jgi:hypothetical protein
MYHKVTLGILCVITLVVLHSTWNVYKKKQESEEMKNLSFEHVQELRDRSSDLQAKIDRLSTQTGIEEEIRSKFSVAKGDENMVIVVDDEVNPAATSTKSGFWAKFTGFFTKK